MNNKDLTQIVQTLIETKIAAKEECVIEWAVQEVIKGQGDVDGPGVEFYGLCAREHVYCVVKKVVGRYDPKNAERDSRQLQFDGWVHLQVAYPIRRDDEPTLVHIDQITNEELLQRAEEYDAQALGLTQHADELRKFVSMRQQAQTG